jgi:hypothetical protein
VPSSCEITVSGSPSAPLRKKISDVTVCDKCPFVRNTQLSREERGLHFDKYDWRMPERKALLSVMTVTLPDDSRGASFFVHVHMVR